MSETLLHDGSCGPSMCLVCGRLTNVVVNINFIASPVCNDCCLTITKQTVRSLTVRSLEVPFE